MIVGCGIDTEEISRFDKYIADIEVSGFVKFVFTDREIENYRSNYRQYMPLGFCCKEAVFKAIENSWTTSDVHWQDIELLINPGSFSDYEIKIGGHTKKIFDDLGQPDIISGFDISDEKATFYVILASE